MNNMRCNLRIAINYSSLLMLLILSGCITPLTTQSSKENSLIAPAETSVPCDACVQATLAAAMTQINDNADYQAVATAEIVRANAQATLASANATLSAVQTQDQNNANIVAAQIAGTAEIVRAAAQATLDSAGATQNAALTQDAIRQTQAADLATTDAQSLLIQQNKDDLAASTQTAIADNIATQTQAAAATSQWYTDQERQREEQRKGPIAFLWMWCLPVFILMLVGFILWGYWRRLKIQQGNQRILESPVERLSEPTIEIVPHQHDDSPPYIESDIIDADYKPMKPDDQVRGWLEEVKRKLLSRDKEDENDHPNN
ncbi:MAG TPA: hypothetical protein VJ987_12065 [Anaerolineales bacterium]|nr:hypothetical protein [Anaerolineales bacterium]